MEDSSISNLKKRKSTFNPWNDARILTHIIGKTSDIAHLKRVDANVMPARASSRNTADIGKENYYNTADKVSLGYLNANNSTLPYSINTVHLQNPYRPPQRLEGFASRDHSKDMYRSQDFTLRSRYNNNLLIPREPVPNKNIEQENEKPERPKKKKYSMLAKFLELLKQYCANSSLHGLRYVGDPELSIVERIFWILSFTAAFATAVYYIWYLYQKLNSAPIIISLSPEPVSLNEFPFPSVTICNMNNVKKSEAKRIERSFDRLDQLLVEDFCNSESNITYDNEEQEIEWSRVYPFMINVSQSCTDMLYFCAWVGNQTDCEKIFNPTMTDEGICCNFNSVNKKYLFYNARDWPEMNITYPSTSIDWNAEDGYKDMPADVVPWRPYGAGLFYGLTLVLDVEADEYYCSSTAGAGFKMLLHSPVETPKIADFAFSITPGEETRVIIRPRLSYASPSIVSIPKKKRKCFFTSERKLRYYRTYTQRNCILECEANFTQTICNCVQYYMPKSSKTPICGKRDEQCAKRARRAMENKLYDESELTITLNVTMPSSCNCWPGCFEINYRTELSQNKLLSSFNIDKRYVKKNMNYFTENMAVVHLFFVDSQFTKYVKNELFGFIEFLSSTGGLLGLFLGFSFLSFMEIIYFLTLRMGYRWYKRRNSPRPAVLKIHPLDDGKKVIYPFTN
nr:PREDICTED: pickpocket protein 28-like [Linepithema humile]